MRKTYQEFKRRIARGDKMRPIWQIALLLPIAIIAQTSTSLQRYIEDKFDPTEQEIADFWKD